MSLFVLAVALQSVLSLAIAVAAALRGTTVGTESPWLAGVVRTVLRIAGASVLGAWLGVTLAMIGRNTAAALGVAFGYLAIVESLLRGFFPKISRSLLSTKPGGVRRRASRDLRGGQHGDRPNASATARPSEIGESQMPTARSPRLSRKAWVITPPGS